MGKPEELPMGEHALFRGLTRLSAWANQPDYTCPRKRI